MTVKGGGYSEIIISSNEEDAREVFAVDLDGDDDMDVIAASLDKIACFKNDGEGGFFDEDIISNSAIETSSLYAVDFDGDEDLDVLFSSSSDHKVVWHENLLGEGCTDELAFNYDENAWLDDGSCCFEYGCTNPDYHNYSESACLDDGSCNYTISGLVFNDENENSTFDGSDFGIAFQTVKCRADRCRINYQRSR